MNEKILVIDDEPLVLSTIKKALDRVGYSVTTTSDIDIFFEILSKEKAPLLIMDLHLGGIKAEDLLRKAKEISPDSRTLLISGSVAGLPERHFLPKPFKIEDLRLKVREILDGP